MSQIVYGANLSAKSFPFLSENWGKTVIVKGPDNVFNAQVAAREDSDKDVGIPQIYYVHNVLPTDAGFQSVGYSQITSSVPGKTFISQTLLRDAADNKVYMAITSAGEVYLNSGSSWVYKTTFTGTYSALTTAYVSGVTYIWIPTVGCYKYDFGTSAFVSVTLTGLDIPTTLGICPSYGYLVAWTKDSIAWSSTIDPTDFVPDLVTGAGGGAVEGIRGAITFCLPHTLGFIIYTTANTVAALFSGNTRFPFNFREIVNSGGVASQEIVSWDSNTGNHYAYTTSGLQLISTSQSQTIYPELTDFISGLRFEDFDETSLVFTTTALTSVMQKKLTVVADRYLVISYGVTSLTHALVFDIAQKRWGKLKIPHIDCFEFQLSNPGVYEIPKQSLAFMQVDGTIKVVDFRADNPSAAGAILLGKFQYARSRLLQLDTIEVENVYNTTFACKVLSCLDGKQGTWSTPYDASTVGSLSKKYLTKLIALNHSILFTGCFKLDSVVLTFNIHGKP
jgi:hypothetical protein